MKRKLLLFFASLLLASILPLATFADTGADEAALRQTMADIAAAFARGDVDAVMAYHHPDVEKALAYKKHLVGREAVKADLAGTLRAFRLEFVEHDVESLLIHGDSVIEMTRFAVRGTPKAPEGKPFLFRGRAMVVYVRYAASPTGWASIREVVQPAAE